jgi:sugar phosphate isomerase/epimerase
MLPECKTRVWPRQDNHGITRRQFVAAVGAGLASTALAAAGHVPQTIGLAFGTYGMKMLSTAAALQTIARIGYDGVELALLPGWPTDPAQISAADRKALSRRIGDLGLAVPALLESLPLRGTPESRATNLERLRRAVALGNELVPASPPVLDTILGGKTAEWDRIKGRMVDELKAWARVLEDGRTTVCMKPHAGDAVHTPERALWLIREVGSSRIRVVYDYSHFYVAGLSLESTLRQLMPYAPLVAVKDSQGTPEKHAYLLPGDGKTDYLAYFRLLQALNYRGFVAVEISGMIHRKPGYQPVPTAELCYARLAPLMERAGIRRPQRSVMH